MKINGIKVDWSRLSDVKRLCESLNKGNRNQCVVVLHKGSDTYNITHKQKAIPSEIVA